MNTADSCDNIFFTFIISYNCTFLTWIKWLFWLNLRQTFYWSRFHTHRRNFPIMLFQFGKYVEIYWRRFVSFTSQFEIETLFFELFLIHRILLLRISLLEINTGLFFFLILRLLVLFFLMELLKQSFCEVIVCLSQSQLFIVHKLFIQ